MASMSRSSPGLFWAWSGHLPCRAVSVWAPSWALSTLASLSETASFRPHLSSWFPSCFASYGGEEAEKSFSVVRCYSEKDFLAASWGNVSVLGCPGRGVIVGWVQPSAGPGCPGLPLCLSGAYCSPGTPHFPKGEHLYVPPWFKWAGHKCLIRLGPQGWYVEVGVPALGLGHLGK